MIPYMRANLAAKRTGLARADAVIAVSRRIADDLRAARAGARADAHRRHPEPVDVEALRAITGDGGRAPAPYALYLGKLAPNKGTDLLIDVVTRASLDWPLVIAGDGPDRASLERAATASGRRDRIQGMGRQGRGVTVARARVDADFPVARS